MKVIARGETDLSWPRQFTTPCCKSVLEIEPDDVKRHEDYTGSFCCHYIDCPVCGKQPTVDSGLKYDGDRWKAQQARIKEAGTER